VLQLKADNERLRQERAAPLGGHGVAASSAPPGSAPFVGVAAVTERLVVIPRDRKCPVLKGRTGFADSRLGGGGTGMYVCPPSFCC